MNSSGRCSEARVHRWQSTLGLAMRARKVVMGDAVLKSIQNGQACLVILADDCVENQRKKICDKCAFYDVPLMRVESGSMIDAAVGEYNRKAAVIIDQGFAKTIQSYMKG